MPHNPASIVRLLYGERVAEEEDRAEALSLNPASNGLTSAPPIGQGRRSRTPGMERASKPVSGSRS